MNNVLVNIILKLFFIKNKFSALNFLQYVDSFCTFIYISNQFSKTTAQKYCGL